MTVHGRRGIILAKNANPSRSSDCNNDGILRDTVIRKCYCQGDFCNDQ